jgi:ComF family protein
MDEAVCVECLRGEPPFAWSVAAGFYGGTLRRAIHLLKYHEKAALAEPLGVLLAQNLGEPSSALFEKGGKEPQFDAVIPVPLHRSRLRARGFNQAERLARVVARERGWQLDTTALQRTKATRSQTTLSGEARRENMRGAFAVVMPQAVVGKSILLIDDVLTTTSTVAECARVLQEAGARRVCVATLARGG